MNELQVFNNPAFGNVRVVERKGEPWFVAADVCRALEIGNPSDALRRLENDEKMTLDLTDSHSGRRGGAQSISIVNEPGLYGLVLGSRKKEAKEFKRWITHEVIPAIRKTGAYLAPTAEQKLTGLERQLKAVEEALAARIYTRPQPEVSLTGLARVLTVTRRVMLDMGSTPEEVGKVARSILNTCGFSVPEFKGKKGSFIDLIDFF